MALTGQITVTTEQLRTQASVVRNELNKMEREFDQIRNLIDGSSSYWVGEAGDAHRKQYTIRISTVEEMFQRYREHIKDLEEMAGIYEAAEQVAREAADSLPASSLD